VRDAGGSSEIKQSKYLLSVKSSVALYETLLLHLQTQYIPNSLFYEYIPSTNPQEAIMNSPLIEQARLSILIKAVDGERAANEPLLCRVSHHQNYLRCIRYIDYSRYIREPIVTIFSPCIPTTEALIFILNQIGSSQQKLLFVVGMGADYWVRCLQEMSLTLQRSGTTAAHTTLVDMKLVRSTCSTHIAPYFLDQPSTRLETVTTLQPFSTHHTLVMIWPMSNMISTSSRDLVEKDEELLLSYEGKRIVMIGDVNYNPLHRSPETVKNYLYEKYECVETIMIPNWREFENTVTVWSRLT
jgi:hypothetical protein